MKPTRTVITFVHVVALGGLALSAALAYKLHEFSGAYRDNLDDVAAVYAESQKVRAMTTQLMAVAQGLRPGLSLSGVDVISGDEFAFGPIESAVLYVFRTDCPFSPENLSLLGQLHAQGTPVIGIVVGNHLPTAQAFARTHGVPFPIVFAASGDPAEILPMSITPLTAVFVDGRWAHAWLGVLDGQKRETLSEKLSLS